MTASRSRLRSRSTQYQTLLNGTVVIISPPSTTPVSYSGRLGGGLETIKDVVTENFTSLRASGKIVNSPMVQRKEIFAYNSIATHDVQSSPVSGIGNIIGDLIGHYGAIIDLYYPTYSLETNMKDLIDPKPLINKAAIEARNRISPILVQSLVSLAELPKTLDLIADSIKSIALIIRGIKSGNFSDIQKGIGNTRKVRSYPNFAKDTVVKRWLELRYGWTPLIMEVQGAIKALGKRDPIKPRATSRRVVSHTEIQNWAMNLVQSGYQDETYSFIFTQTVKARAYCLYEAELTTRLARDFGVEQFPLAAWELVPYSFVVDWFIPIGNWIEALTPKLGIKILAEGIVVSNDRILSRMCSAQSAPIVDGLVRYTRTGVLNNTDIYSTSVKERIPSLKEVLLQLPSPDVKLNVKRVADSVALLLQITGKSRTIRT